ncbi:MAG: FecR family protein [Cyclobacteriaceae bacterium]
MGNAQEDIWVLLAREFNGELTDQEKHALQAWQNAHPDNQLTYQQMKQLWKEARPPAQAYEPDLEKGWQRFSFSLDSEQGTYDLHAPAGEKEGKTVYRPYLSAVAASVVLLLSLGLWWWQADSNTITLRTLAGERQMIWLPDSSQVWLNENSWLSYEEGFDTEHRVVELSGEAFFEVKEAEGRRFTIFSEGAKTEVIGTAFNLRAYPGEPVKVQVSSGKVAFSPAGEDNSVFLTPGEEATLVPDAAVKAEAVPIEDPNFRAWQNQQLLFENTSLKYVISTLEKVYKTDIRLSNPDLANCRYTATFDGASLDDVLYVLSVTGNLRVEQQAGTYLISGNGCR